MTDADDPALRSARLAGELLATQIAVRILLLSSGRAEALAALIERKLDEWRDRLMFMPAPEDYLAGIEAAKKRLLPSDKDVH